MIDVGFEFGGHTGQRFRLDKELGRGGMGAVFQARDRQLSRDVAIKVILPEITAEFPRAAELFQREAEALAKIRDPGVVTIYDNGEGLDKDGKTQFLYLVMELVRGSSLGSNDHVPQRSWIEAARIVRDLARQVHAIHGAGVIHRDLNHRTS